MMSAIASNCFEHFMRPIFVDNKEITHIPQAKNSKIDEKKNMVLYLSPIMFWYSQT